MAIVKVAKTKAYFKRFQVKFRRRREGKTDYYARRKLVTQDNRKYNSPKYRLVVRITRRDVICQIIAARLAGDEVISAAYSHELPKYGIKVGLTNYAAAYATGLLLARRTLKKLGLDETYVGKEEVDGEMYQVEAEGEKRPFRAILDVGLHRTTTGHRIFAAMKGAVDGGIDVPHNEKRFPAYNKEDGFQAEELKKRLLGEHVQEYMEYLQEEDPDKYQTEFKRYIDAGIEPDGVTEMYTSAHEKIREDPSFTKKEKTHTGEHKKWNKDKISLEQRQQNIRDKIAAAVAAAAAE